MVGDRPVIGVRNPVCPVSPSSYLRAKNRRATHSVQRHLIFTAKRVLELATHFATTSEPSPAAGGGATIPSQR